MLAPFFFHYHFRLEHMYLQYSSNASSCISSCSLNVFMSIYTKGSYIFCSYIDVDISQFKSLRLESFTSNRFITVLVT
jgi:hypothetical protein